MDSDSERKGKCAVIKTSTRQVGTAHGAGLLCFTSEHITAAGSLATDEVMLLLGVRLVHLHCITQHECPVLSPLLMYLYRLTLVSSPLPPSFVDRPFSSRTLASSQRKGSSQATLLYVNHAGGCAQVCTCLHMRTCMHSFVHVLVVGICCCCCCS